MSDDDFLAWRSHPVTEVVLSYLRDFAGAIRNDWRAGVNWSDDARLKVEVLEDLAEIDLWSIETFYKAREEHERSREDPEPESY